MTGSLWDHVSPILSPAMYFPTMPLVDAWVTLSAIAMRTERIRIGPMVTPMARRRPQKVARETVTLDHLSGGRVTLGVGLGGDTEFEWWGEDPDDKVRAAKLDEALAIVTGLWTAEAFSFQGKHHAVHETVFPPAPVQSPRIPIWVAGSWPNKAPMRRAARYDGAFPTSINWAKGEVLAPSEYREIRGYIARHRSDDGAFDMVHMGSMGDDGSRATAIVGPYADAGVTWWLDDCESLDAARRRIETCPPHSI